MTMIPGRKAISNYFGGKSGAGVYQTIINQIPPIDLYVEAMVGGGGIYHHLRPPVNTVINDIDVSVIEKYVDAGHADLPGVLLISEDYKKVIDLCDHGVPERTLFYFDPPYLKSTRRSDRDVYRFEWSDNQHMEFLRTAGTVNSLCVISHYPCPMYDDALADWRRVEFQAMTRKGLATECIWMNYPEPEVLHDIRYVGADYIERQRIKRKAARWVAGLERLPLHERQVILSGIIAKYG